MVKSFSWHNAKRMSRKEGYCKILYYSVLLEIHNYLSISKLDISKTGYKSMKAPAVSMGVLMLKTPDISKSLISKLLL